MVSELADVVAQKLALETWVPMVVVLVVAVAMQKEVSKRVERKALLEESVAVVAAD